MIYGVNFNNSHIPAHIERQFAKHRKVVDQRVRLQGVCNTSEECQTMIITADNGHRRITFVGPRKIAGEAWYGVYCS